MPKKRNNTAYAKPGSYVHPSLSASTSTASPTKSGLSSKLVEKAETPSTVNDLIASSRRNHSHVTEKDRQALTAIATAPTVHPSLKDILQVADIPTPRLRAGMRPPMRGTRGGPRGPAGPAPPSSWLSASRHAPPASWKGEHVPDRAYPESVERLPGIQQPDTRTLLHMTLKTLAIDWEWHVLYNQHYLATLPATLKISLLAYIAVHGNGVNLESLQTLFKAEHELEDATGSEDITHLDLSNSLGHSITFSQLNKYFTLPQETISRASGNQDSWEDEAIVFIPRTLGPPRFPHLTHLSLSHPAPTTTWSQLMSFLPHLATLTNLSLAYWPWPSQKPKAKTTSVISKNSPKIVDYGASNYYSIYDGDFSEAAIMLRRLSKATYCLKWLDLEGCTEWLPALTWRSEDEDLDIQGPKWNNEWRQIETIIMSQGWVPENLRRPAVLKGYSALQAASDGPEQASRRDFSIHDLRQAVAKSELDDVELRGWLKRERKAKEAASRISKCRADVGGLRVEFEHGWEGWWIEDALKG